MPRIDNSIIVKITKSVRQIISPANNQNNSELINNIKINLEINILYTDSDIAYGYIKWNKKKRIPKIIIYRRISPNIQLFTIARELGHLFLHWKWTPSTDLSKGASIQYDILDAYNPTPMYRKNISSVNIPKEEDVDEFAGNLLMPKESMQKIYKCSNTKNPDYVKYKVNNKLCVSSSADYTRLSKLQQRNEL